VRCAEGYMLSMDFFIKDPILKDIMGLSGNHENNPELNGKRLRNSSCHGNM
jgi:hypothetical protein